MAGTLGAIIGGGTAMQLGSQYGSLSTVWTLVQLFCAVFGTLTVGGLIADFRKNHELTLVRRKEKEALRRIAKRHNDVTGLLESSYLEEKRATGLFDRRKRESLRALYEQRYFQNRNEYKQECKQLAAAKGADSPTTRKFKKFWKTVIAAGLLCQLAACSYTLGTISLLSTTPQTPPAPQLGETIEWNAENIPMPHLTDGARYVSNPDGVVSAHTEQLLNQQLKRMDDSLQIESAMIIVNHVEGQDIFSFAQGIFDRYHVGKEDRGLVVVLAYGDHLVRSHTGRALEADLTDVECSRLQQTYAIPFMKAEQPDSGMLYLTEAIYNTLKGKELPLTMSQKKEAEADEAFGVVSIYLVLFGFWAILIGYLLHRYGVMRGDNMLRPNPFAKAPVVIVGGGGGRGGGGFGGGGFSGGGFSGGSSGGGGATSSW